MPYFEPWYLLLSSPGALSPESVDLVVFAAASKPEKAFLDEDGEVKSISDAGSLDDIDSDHELPSEFENPMTQMAASAMSSLRSGELMGVAWPLPSLTCRLFRATCVDAGHDGRGQESLGGTSR